MDKEITFQSHSGEKLSFLFIGLYVWLVTVSFGAILLDIVYSSLLYGVVGDSETAAVFSEVADFLLLIGGVTVLAAIATIGFSWRSKLARNLFIASLFIIVFKFLVPVLFSQFFQDVDVVRELRVGSWIRLTTSGLASILAFTGLFGFYRQR